MSTVSGDEATATCPHCEQVNIPSADTPIHKEECCQCFDSDISEGGLNLCLTCFTGGCAGGNNHSGRHFELSKHPIVLNIVKTRLPDAEITLTSDPATGGVKTLEDVKVDDLAPKFEYTRRAYCLACKHHVSTAADVNAKIAKAVAMVLSLEGASVIKDTAFETEKPEKCSHTGDSTKPNNVGLKQVSPLPDLSNAQLAKCTECDLTENLWLCLTCGALACPRKAYDGTGGNGHAEAHYKATGHPVVLKAGTITPTGTADLWCYPCSNPVIDDQLVDHLSAFGIAVADQRVTAKTMAELNLEQNLNAQFNSVYDKSGVPQTLYFGPGLTGLENLGNSCYMNSVLQACLHLPAFVSRYAKEGQAHIASCRSQRPGTCYLCQVGKLGVGLWSGRYSHMPTEAEAKEYEESNTRKAPTSSTSSSTSASAMDDKESPAKLHRVDPALSSIPANEQGNMSDATSSSSASGVKISRAINLQPGVAPRMVKKLIANNHPLFSGTEQQCAFEYFCHFREQIHRQEVALKEKGVDVTDTFAFYINNRIQCLDCSHVKYKTTRVQDLSIPVPYIEPSAEDKEKAAAEAAAKEAASAANKDSSSSSSSSDEKKMSDGKPKTTAPAAPPQPPASFKECMDLWNKDELIEGFNCPVCQTKTIAASKTGFLTFPETLAVQVRRFGLFDKKSWVPTKLLTDITFDGTPDGEAPEVDLSQYMLTGPKDGEALMPEGKSDGPGAGGAGAGAGQAPEDLVAMVMDITQADPTIINYALLQCNLDMERAIDWVFSHPDFEIPSASSAGGNKEQAKIEADTKPAHFGLKSFIYHKGPSTLCGHYIAHVYNPHILTPSNGSGGDETKQADLLEGVVQQAKQPTAGDAQLASESALLSEKPKGWVCFNDQRVHAEKETSMGQAYMYFFQRK